MRKLYLRPWTAAIAGLLLVSTAATPRLANAQDAGGFIQNLGTRAIQVLGPSVPEAQRTAEFRQLLASDFDLAGLARFVLGPYGHGLTPEQHQQFMTLLRDSLAQSYSKRLSEYAGDPFHVTGTHAADGETVVTSQVIRQGGAPVRIDWHVADHGGRFLITDVYVDGASQKVAQRDEFAGIIQRNGGRPDALLAALRQEIQQGAPPPQSGSSSYGPMPPLPPEYRPVAPPR